MENLGGPLAQPHYLGDGPRLMGAPGYFVQLGEEILLVGHMQKRKAQRGQTEVTGEDPPAMHMVQAIARKAWVCRFKPFDIARLDS